MVASMWRKIYNNNKVTYDVGLWFMLDQQLTWSPWFDSLPPNRAFDQHPHGIKFNPGMGFQSMMLLIYCWSDIENAPDKRLTSQSHYKSPERTPADKSLLSISWRKVFVLIGKYGPKFNSVILLQVRVIGLLKPCAILLANTIPKCDWKGDDQVGRLKIIFSWTDFIVLLLKNILS